MQERRKNSCQESSSNPKKSCCSKTIRDTKEKTPPLMHNYSLTLKSHNPLPLTQEIVHILIILKQSGQVFKQKLSCFSPIFFQFYFIEFIFFTFSFHFSVQNKVRLKCTTLMVKKRLLLDFHIHCYFLFLCHSYFFFSITFYFLFITLLPASLERSNSGQCAWTPKSHSTKQTG